MRIAILSRNENLYSTMRLKQAGEERGHQVDVIDTLHCYMDITSNNPKIRYMGEELPQYDAVIPRIGASITFYGTAVVRQFEMMGTFCVNESVAISRFVTNYVHYSFYHVKGLACHVLALLTTLTTFRM